MKTKDKENNILSITQIKLKLSDKKEITLSSDEARIVYEELGKLFKLEDKEKLESDIERLKKLFPEKEYIPYPVYTRPIWVEHDPYWPQWKKWEITCSNSASETVKFGAPETSALMINLTSNS